MAIKLRRGLEIDRMPIVFAQGEIVYVTDTKKVFIGDGVTYGGNLVTGEELLSALDDVQLASLANDDVLIYESASSKWKNTPFGSKVRAVVLTGLSTATNAVISATDSVLVAFGKLQAQVNAKQATITGAATTITTSNLTVSRAVIANASGKVAVSSVTDTELSYVSGVSSAIQTQITANLSTLTSHTSNTSNPHATTKAQVGLTNVADVDTTNASNIASGTLSDSRLSSAVTTQGNTFNGASQLVKLDASTKLPAIDGSNLTNLPISPSTGGDLYLFYNY